MPATESRERDEPFDPALPPSVPFVFYLFADRLIPAARFGTATPVSTARLKTGQFATMLFGVAFWHLRNLGVLQLLDAAGAVSVRRTSTAATVQDGLMGGLLQILDGDPIGSMTAGRASMPKFLLAAAESSLGMSAQLASMPRSKLPAVLRDHVPSGPTPPATVLEVVGQWYGSVVLSPEQLVIEWMEREGTAKGLFVRGKDERSLLAKAFGKTTLLPQRQRIAALEPQFAELSRSWAAFQRSEPALFRRIEQDVEAAILQKTDTSKADGTLQPTRSAATRRRSRR
jgi:hypothetical protein